MSDIIVVLRFVWLLQLLIFLIFYKKKLLIIYEKIMNKCLINK